MAPDELTNRIYWAKRDELEKSIVRQEASLASRTNAQYTFEREINDSLAADLRANREALASLGEPPAPRPRAGDPSKRRERIARRALEGLLAGDPTIDCPTATKRALAHADTLIAALDRHEGGGRDLAASKTEGAVLSGASVSRVGTP